MKLKNLFIASLSLISIILPSCDDNDDTVIVGPNALVTVKSSGDNTCYLQLDDNTTLLPQNMQKSPFGDKEVRALASLSEIEGEHQGYTKLVRVNWIDSILTKEMIITDIDDLDEKFGNDPVEIIKDWVTVAEDGYLTLRFRTVWGNIGKIHTVNLVKSENIDDPYEIEFRHNANGDNQIVKRDGLVAFRLSELADTKGDTVDLTLKWNSFEGPKSTKFKYCTRKSSVASKTQLMNLNPSDKLQ